MPLSVRVGAQNSKQIGLRNRIKKCYKRGKDELTLEDQTFASFWLEKWCPLAAGKSSKLLEMEWWWWCLVVVKKWSQNLRK